MSSTALAIALLSGFLLGSVPASILVARRVGNLDIRDHGSGNAGAANVLRVLGWRPAVVVLLVDAGKGWLAVVLAAAVGTGFAVAQAEALRLAAGLGAVLGHVWPVYARFRGGKGVATAGGAMLAICPPAAAAAVAIFLVTVSVSRRIALGSVVSAVSLPLVLLGIRGADWMPVAGSTVGFAVFLGLLIPWTHRRNLRNLLSGTEPKLGDSESAHRSPGSSLR